LVTLKEVVTFGSFDKKARFSIFGSCRHSTKLWLLYQCIASQFDHTTLTACHFKEWNLYTVKLQL